MFTWKRKNSYIFTLLAPQGALGGVVFLDRSKPSQANPELELSVSSEAIWRQKMKLNQLSQPSQCSQLSELSQSTQSTQSIQSTKSTK